MCKKILSVLLSLVLVFSGIAILPVWAEEEATTLESVQVNQVGYIVGFTKSFVAARTVDDGAAVTFELVDSAGKAVFTGTMQKEDTPYAGTANEWPHIYYTGDFTGFDTPGKYNLRVTCGAEMLTSPAFSIGGTEIYTEALNAILSYMRGERDFGRSIGGKDNRYTQNQYNNNEILDLHGGWYDASNRPAVYMGYVDNYNYMVCTIESNTSYQLFAAYEANKAYYDKIDYNHNGVPDILEEAAWGCDWYVRLKPQAITGGYFYNGPEHNKIHSNESVKAPVSIRMGAGTAMAALAKAVRYQLDGEYTYTEYGENAKQAWDWYIENNATLACEDGMEHLMDDIYWALAAMEMYETFGDKKYLDKAQESVDKVLARQTADDNFSGWFELGMEEYNQKGEGGPYHNWLDEAAVLYPLIGYATLRAEDTARVEKIKTAVAAYMDFKLAVANDSGSNPYGYAKQYFRHDVADADSTLTRFFQYETGRPTSAGPVTNGWVSGENGRLLSLLYASLLADDFLGTDKYLDYGLAQLNWVYGVNPFYAVMQAGIGEGRNLAEEIGHGGSVPYGGFINGIRGDYKNKIEYDTGYTDSIDIPFIDQSYWTGEWFLPIGTDGLVAFSKLMGLYGEETLLPKNTPIEAEDHEYLLTTELGSNMSQKNFEVLVKETPATDSGYAVTGVDADWEGVIFTNAPAASCVMLSYAAENAGTIGVYVNGKRTTLPVGTTGGSDKFANVYAFVDVKAGDTLSVQFEKGDTPISLDSITFTDVTLETVGDVAATTLTGTAPILPAAVKAIFSDGTDGWAGVIWEDIPASHYAQAGQFAVTGHVSGNVTLTATVTVYARGDYVRIRPVYQAIGEGQTPHLPDEVEVIYENSAGFFLPVTWEDAAGKTEVAGTVEGIADAATAYIVTLEEFPDNVSDLAYKQPVTATSDDGSNPVEFLNDGDLATRWASDKTDKIQYVIVDFGSEQAVGSTVLTWERAFAKGYSLSVSPDCENWTTVYETDASDGEEDVITLEQPAYGRYLRLTCREYGYDAWKAYSLYDLQVYGAPYAENFIPATALSLQADKLVLDELNESLRLSPVFYPATASIRSVVWQVTDLDGKATDLATIDKNGVLKGVKNGFVKVTATAVDGSGCVGEQVIQIIGQPDESNGNLALKRPLTVSGVADNNPAANAVDGDPVTRWSGRWGSSEHFLYVDLGKSQPVNRVNIRWEAAYAKDYTISVSDTAADGSWQTVYTATDHAGGNEELAFATVNARYVRLDTTRVAMAEYGISLWEFEVYYYEKITATAADVANVLKETADLAQNTNALLLPTHAGFDVTLVSSSNPAVIAADGSVTAPAADTDVTLTLSVESLTDPADTATAVVTLTVKGTTATYAALQQQVETGRTLSPEDYTPASFALLAKALAWGELLLTDATAQPTELELATAAIATAKAELQEQDACRPGDVNGDGNITVEDALTVLQAVTGKVTLTEEQTAAADVDGETGIAVGDALCILQKVTGKITRFPVEVNA